jgi:type I restriction enzyme, R subunit
VTPEPGAERSDPNYRDVLLERRLRQAVVLLNPALPAGALEDALATERVICAVG